MSHSGYLVNHWLNQLSHSLANMLVCSMALGSHMSQSVVGHGNWQLPNERRLPTCRTRWRTGKATSLPVEGSVSPCCSQQYQAQMVCAFSCSTYHKAVPMAFQKLVSCQVPRSKTHCDRRTSCDLPRRHQVNWKQLQNPWQRGT